MRNKKTLEMMGLEKTTLDKIFSSMTAYQEFLTFSSELYKYSFLDKVLIYAQKPSATAVAGISTWNDMLGRYVNKGSRAIFTFADNRKGIINLHDIEDTHSIDGKNKQPKKWIYDTKYDNSIIDELVEAYKLDSINFTNINFKDKMENIVYNRLADYYNERKDNIQSMLQGSKFFKYSDERSLHYLLPTMTHGAVKIVDERMKVNFKRFDIQENMLDLFDTYESRLLLGCTSHNLAKEILLSIGQTIKMEQKNELMSHADERSYENEKRIYRSGWNQVSQRSLPLQTEAIGEIREHEAAISNDLLQGYSGNGESISDGRNLSTNAERSLRHDGTIDRRTYESQSTARDKQHDGNASAQEHNTSTSRGDSYQGADRDRVSVPNEPLEANERADTQGSFFNIETNQVDFKQMSGLSLEFLDIISLADKRTKDELGKFLSAYPFGENTERRSVYIEKHMPQSYKKANKELYFYAVADWDEDAYNRHLRRANVVDETRNLVFRFSLGDTIEMFDEIAKTEMVKNFINDYTFEKSEDYISTLTDTQSAFLRMYFKQLENISLASIIDSDDYWDLSFTEKVQHLKSYVDNAIASSDNNSNFAVQFDVTNRIVFDYERKEKVAAHIAFFDWEEVVLAIDDCQNEGTIQSEDYFNGFSLEEPYVFIKWSENRGFTDGELLTLSEMNEKIRNLEGSVHEDRKIDEYRGYDKVRFFICYKDRNGIFGKEDIRYDLGDYKDEESGLFSFLKRDGYDIGQDIDEYVRKHSQPKMIQDTISKEKRNIEIIQEQIKEPYFIVDTDNIDTKGYTDGDIIGYDKNGTEYKVSISGDSTFLSKTAGITSFGSSTFLGVPSNIMLEINDYLDLELIGEADKFVSRSTNRQVSLGEVEKLAEPLKLDNSGEFPETDNRNDEIKSETKNLLQNYSLPSTLYDERKGEKERFRDNISAIKIVNDIKETNRLVTEEEKEQLSRYVGFGGLANAFDERNDSWASEYQKLKVLLSEEQYEQAKSSTLDAFYTPYPVIQGIYKALDHFGFEEGRILEPSVGTGNFLGYLPEKMSRSKVTGIEIDEISARISSLLYPSADIQHKGLEETKLLENSFDIVVGNVPFGNFGVYDPKFNKHNFLIHDYFFAKSLDLLRPNGIIALVTSTGTLDKSSQKFRRYLAERAELLGAIRLPNDTFTGHAGTKVTTDIIFLQKRTKALTLDPSWVYTSINEDGLKLNEYFIDHPDMILGKLEEVSSQFGKTLTVNPFFSDFETDINRAVNRLVANVYIEQNEKDFDMDIDSKADSIIADSSHRNFSYYHVKNKLHYCEDGYLLPQVAQGKQLERVTGLIELRDTTRNLINAQLEACSDEKLKELQGILGKQYDEFVRNHGAIGLTANKMAFREDGDLPLLLSLEETSVDDEIITKADMFFKRTIIPRVQKEFCETALEALLLSLYEFGHVKMDFMEMKTQQSVDEIVSELEGKIYQNPANYLNHSHSAWEIADEYLSGDVVTKLEIAREKAENYPNLFSQNIVALESIQPEKIEAIDIDVKLGTSWIGESYTTQFIYELLQLGRYEKSYLDLKHDKDLGEWIVHTAGLSRDRVLVNETYGTRRADAYALIKDALNMNSIKIYDRDAEDKRIFNPKETILAREKQDLIKLTFKEWIFKDIDRRNDLEEKYNAIFNRTVDRSYDGSYLEFEGMNPEIKLIKHQENAIARILLGGNTLLAHEVGAGKTFVMIAAGMEMKRIGIANKPMYIVPKHLIDQFASEFLRLYPSARVLVAGDKDFARSNRQRFVGKIATGDYDGIIMAHSSFEKISLSKETREREIKKQIDELESRLKDKDIGISVKRLAGERKRLEERLKKILSETGKDRLLDFEELGVDTLFIDEAHSYKNLYLSTKIQNVAGISTTNALKSSDMHLKIQYINERSNERNVVFATGTPISNSMTEFYTMQRYLQPLELKRMQMEHFDSWASTFGEISNTLELAPEGNGYRQRARFAKFHNLPELMTSFRKIADIQTADMLDLPVPRLKNGQATIIKAPASFELKEKLSEFSDRADAIRGGNVNPSIDNMLKLTHEGKLMALDIRLMNVMHEDYDNSKINMAVENIFKIHKDKAEDRLTQLVFCDMSTPRTQRRAGNKVSDQPRMQRRAERGAFDQAGNMSSSELANDQTSSNFNVYDDIKNKLISKGVEPDEIAYIHEAKTDAQRKRMFESVRNGDIRILIGSTQKMGSGTNVQTKLYALHHLDVPWRPSDVVQREGRMLRQGNENKEVEIFRYVTEESFDAYSWQIIENKYKFISQVMSGKSVSRSINDADDTALSYAEIKAIASGNPLIKEKMEIDIEIAKIYTYKREFDKNKHRLQDTVHKKLPFRISKLRNEIKTSSMDKELVSKHQNEPFQIELVRQKYREVKDANEKIQQLIGNCRNSDEKIKIGTYKEMDIYYQHVKTHFEDEHILFAKGSGEYKVATKLDTYGHVRRLDNIIGFEVLEGRTVEATDNLARNEDELILSKEELSKPFSHKEVLQNLTKRQIELNSLLNFDKTDDIIVDSKDFVTTMIQEETTIETDFTM